MLKLPPEAVREVKTENEAHFVRLGIGRAVYAFRLAYGELPDMKYSLVGPLFSTPLWFLGTISRTPWWWTSRFNVIVLGAGLLCICLLLKDRLPRLCR